MHDQEISIVVVIDEYIVLHFLKVFCFVLHPCIR